MRMTPLMADWRSCCVLLLSQLEQ